jgi:hypothetical protein
LFFLNGGTTALIVGLINDAAVPATTATRTLFGNTKLSASSPGVWGDALQVAADFDGLSDTSGNTKFNLTITDQKTGASESYRGLAISARGARIGTRLPVTYGCGRP